MKKMENLIFILIVLSVVLKSFKKCYKTEIKDDKDK